MNAWWKACVIYIVFTSLFFVGMGRLLRRELDTRPHVLRRLHEIHLLVEGLHERQDGVQRNQEELFQRHTLLLRAHQTTHRRLP